MNIRFLAMLLTSKPCKASQLPRRVSTPYYWVWNVREKLPVKFHTPSNPSPSDKLSFQNDKKNNSVHDGFIIFTVLPVIAVWLYPSSTRDTKKLNRHCQIHNCMWGTVCWMLITKHLPYAWCIRSASNIWTHLIFKTIAWYTRDWIHHAEWGDRGTNTSSDSFKLKIL